MVEKEHFIKPLELELSAAAVGINREDWYCYKPGIRQSEVISIMKSKKFDIVPIINESDFCNSYYTYNQDSLETKIINENEKLYYLTHIRDVIWSMNKDKKTHYFLSNGRNEHDIVGLISLSNLNSRDFYLYLFSTISSLELEFSNLIESSKEVAFEILGKNSTNTNLKKQLSEIEYRINDDENNGNENNYKEYLYFSNLITLVKVEEKYKELNYKNVSQFEKNIGLLKDIRNTVAHPVKSIVNNFEDLEKLNKGIEKIFELRERFRNRKLKLD
jgi:hypothetical protein